MTLKNEVIFILGITKFDADIESTSFTTAKYLAKENDVYYIDYPVTFKDYLKNKGTERHKKRRKSFFSVKNCLISTDIERLKILVLPPVLSINFLSESMVYRTLLTFNEQIIVNRIKGVIERKNISKYIYINSFNFHYPNIGSILKPDLTVYQCVDPLVIEHDRRHGIKSEKIILNKSDLVICTSKQLCLEKSNENKNTYFIPNAADLDHCSKALDEDLNLHFKISEIRKPIVGYFGNIERRIDLDLLSETIKSNPKINFVFAGPVDNSYIPDSFIKMDNVHFIGRVFYEELPSVLKGFDVAIIPFKKDEVSNTIFPLKLFEYLGAGKPVVSTDFNQDLKEYTGDSVIYCTSSSEFITGIITALTLNSEKNIKKRLRIAADNTWEKRLAELSELIAKHHLTKCSFSNKALYVGY